MALDKKQIALSVGGILAGLSLTYILWKRSQTQAAATTAAAAAAAAEQTEQDSQSVNYASAGLSSAGGGGGGGIVNNYSDTPPTQTGTASGDDDASDVSSIINQILGQGNSSLQGIAANALIPEVDISDASTALTGIDTSAAEILGYAPAGTVSTTVSTGQGYGATTAVSAGANSNVDSSGPISPTTPVPSNPAHAIYSGSPASRTVTGVNLSSSLVN